MKQFSVFIALATTMIGLLSASIVSANPVDHGNTNGGGNTNGNANGNANEGGNNDPDDDDSPVRVLFKYDQRNADKANNAKNEAKKIGKLGVDIPRLGIASVMTNNRNYKAFQKNPNIEAAELDLEVFADGYSPMLRGGPNQQDRRRQLTTNETQPYGIRMVQADQVSLADVPPGTDPIMVCVVDTGYTPSHPDLPPASGGYSPYFEQPWDVDIDKHGTHVAGTIAAIRGNGIGVDSVLGDPSKFDIFIGKGLSDSGSGPWSSVLAATEACVDAGAKVINLSLGSPYYPGDIMYDGFKEIFNAGVLIVAAAGNNGGSGPLYPASFNVTMSVAAVDSNGKRVGFSQTHTQVEIAAPGVNVKSTIPPTGYANYQGTSMAAPHVSGVAALVWSHYPDCSNLQIRNVLLKSAKDKGAIGCDRSYGFGIVKAKFALDLLDVYGCIAGNEDPAELSSGAVGGCEQTDLSLPPAPSSTPTVAPTLSISPSVSSVPSMAPSEPPSSSSVPSRVPSGAPSEAPSASSMPSLLPSEGPSVSHVPSASSVPSRVPSEAPTLSVVPSQAPSEAPTLSAVPSQAPSEAPTLSLVPTISSVPSLTPSETPTISSAPSLEPSSEPSSVPSLEPSSTPSDEPSSIPSFTPSFAPTQCKRWFETCQVDSECCSGKCRGQNQNRSCKASKGEHFFGE